MLSGGWRVFELGRVRILGLMKVRGRGRGRRLRGSKYWVMRMRGGRGRGIWDIEMGLRSGLRLAMCVRLGRYVSSYARKIGM